MAKAVFETQAEMYTVEEATDCFERLVAVEVEESTFNTKEACEIAMKKIEVNMPGYQIIGDTLDLHINVKHMSTNNKNKSLHLFNMLAIKDEVSGTHLPNHSQKTLEDVTVADFLPLADDVTQLKKDLIPLWSRVMVSQLKEFRAFRSAVVWHIPNEYSNIMQQPSKKVENYLLWKKIIPLNSSCSTKLLRSLISWKKVC